MGISKSEDLLVTVERLLRETDKIVNIGGKEKYCF